MQLIIDGILLGLTLTILLGPIFVALTQTGIQKGARAGISVGTGIWTSDLLVIISSYVFIKQIDDLSNHPNFQFWMGLTGGFVLIVFGIGSLIKNPAENTETPAFSAKSYAGYWTKGFVVNFFNPFTFVFWIGVMSSYVIGKAINGFETILLFGTIMITIMITDSSKVLLAKYLRNKMTTPRVHLFGRIAGIALIVFGIVLIFRSNVIEF